MPVEFYQLGIVYFLLQAQFWFPIWVIFLLDRGLTLMTIVIADIIFRAAVIFFEVPCGVIGDRIGRKSSYFLSAVLGTITFFVMTLIDSFFLLIITWLIWAFFLAMLSGTDTAYLYELTLNTHLEQDATHIFGLFGAITSASLLCTHIVAGFLYNIHSNLPIIFNGFFTLAAALVILTLPNPQTAVSRPTLRKIVSETANICKTNRNVRNVILLIALFLMAHWTLTLLFQPYFKEVGIEVAAFGVVFVLYTGIGIIGSLLSGPISRKMGERSTIMFSFLVLMLAVGFAGYIAGFWGVLGIIMLNFAFQLADPILKTQLNREVANHSRASLLSFANMIGSLLLMGSRPLVGYIAELVNYKFAFQVWFGICVILCFIIIIIASKLHQASSRS